MKDEDGEPFTLSSLRGRRNVVLVFFPAAFSGVCTAQLQGMGGNESRYAGTDAQVLGISIDQPHALKAFSESLGLKDTRLLSDYKPQGEVARRYGAWNEEWGWSRRATFVIDKEGIVRSAVLSEPLEVPDEEAYFSALAACAI